MEIQIEKSWAFHQLAIRSIVREIKIEMENGEAEVGMHVLNLLIAGNILQLL